jgi:hypothetical protein
MPGGRLTGLLNNNSFQERRNASTIADVATTSVFCLAPLTIAISPNTSPRPRVAMISIPALTSAVPHLHLHVWLSSPVLRTYPVSGSCSGQI